MGYDPGVIAAAVAGIVLLAVLARLARSAWAAVMRGDHLTLMTRMLARQGVQVPAGSTQAVEAGGRAVLRCALCSETARCERYLAAGGGEGIEAFCPNAGFIRAMQHGRFNA